VYSVVFGNTQICGKRDRKPRKYKTY